MIVDDPVAAYFSADNAQMRGCLWAQGFLELILVIEYSFQIVVPDIGNILLDVF